MWTPHLTDKWLRLIYACTYVRMYVCIYASGHYDHDLYTVSVLTGDTSYRSGPLSVHMWVGQTNKCDNVAKYPLHVGFEGSWAESLHEESDIDRSFPGLKTNREYLLKDDLGRYCPKTFETARERKKGSATSSQTQGLWLKPRALCHWALTPTDSHSSLFPFYYFVLSDCAEIRKRSIAACRWLLDLTPLMVLQIQH